MGLDQYIEVVYKKPEVQMGEKFPFSDQKRMHEITDEGIKFVKPDKVCDKLKALKFAVPVEVEYQKTNFTKLFIDKLNEAGYDKENYYLRSMVNDDYTFVAKTEYVNPHEITITIPDEEMEAYRYFEWENRVAMSHVDEFYYWRKNYVLQAYMNELGYGGRNVYCMYISKSDIENLLANFEEFADKWFNEIQENDAEAERYSDTWYKESDIQETINGFKQCLDKLENDDQATFMYYEWY